MHHKNPHCYKMRKTNLGILTAALALAVAAPLGARQPLTVKTQKAASGQSTSAQASPRTLLAPATQGRADDRTDVQISAQGLAPGGTPDASFVPGRPNRASDVPLDLPYIKTFPTEASVLEEMTIIDADNDGNTWGWDKYQKYARHSHSNQNASADDWIITPPLKLKAGKVYEYSSLISAGNPNAFPPTVEMRIGTAPTVAGMTQEIVAKTQITKYDTYFKAEFTVPADGNYYLGIHACSEQWLALIKLMNINVIGGAEAEGPAKVTDALIEPDYSGRTRNVSISFKAPTQTGTGKALTEMTKIDIMRKGIVVKTFDNPAPGQAYSYTDKVDADGEYAYKIVPYNSVGMGGAVEATVEVGTKGKPVPYLEDFKTEAGFEALTFVDANNDGTSFWHATATTPPYAWLHYSGKADSSSDDYLITPGIALEPGIRYRVSADAWGYNEGFAMMVGTAPKVDSLVSHVKVPYTRLTSDMTNYSGEFTVPEAGNYFIGIHVLTPAGERYEDFHVTNIRMDRMGALKGPGKVTGFKAIADKDGQAKLTFKFNAPTANMDGSALDAITKIEVTRDGNVVKTFEAPAKGEALEYTDAPGEEGEYAYVITPFNEAGGGEIAEYLGYAGLDLPAAPVNVKATDLGGGKVKVTWDPVTTTAHGAEIPTPPIYVILEGDGVKSEQLGQTTKCEYTTQALNGEQQRRVFYNIYPFNSASEHGDFGASQDLFIGDAYTLSFLESFADGHPASPVVIDNLIFQPEWSLCTDETFSDFECSDGDNGFLAQKGFPSGKGRLSTGRITLANTISPTLSFYTANINASDYHNELAVYVNEFGTDTWTEVFNKKIREVVPARGWGRISIDLAQWKGKDIRIGFVPKSNYTDDSHASYYGWTFIDAIRVHNLTNRDLGANIAASAESVETGNDVDFTVIVTNNGEQPAAAYRVDLYKNGKVVDSLNGTNLASGRNEKFVFSQSFNVADSNTCEFYAVAVLENDENTADNTSKTVRVSVNKPIYPTIASINAKERESARGTIDIEWAAPTLDNVPPAPYKETFENAETGNKTGVNGWTFVDVDDDFIGGFQQFNFPGLTSDGTSKASFFVVDKNSAELGQFASLFAGNGGSAKSIGSLLGWSADPDDWAVSPELYGGPQFVSFYAKNLQDNMPEQVELWCSTGSADTKDFTFVGKWGITKSTWEKISAYLPNGTKRVAIRHNYRGGILQVDDIEFRRAGDQPESITLKGYNIYRDGEKLNDALITDRKYTDTGLEQGEYTYAVNPVYDRGEGDTRSTTVSALTVGGIDTDTNVAVFGAQGAIDIIGAAGQTVRIVTTDGRAVHTGTATESMRISAQAGIYIVKVGARAFKVTVK